MAASEIRIFYSWQSDLPGNQTRNLIQSGIDTAVKALKNTVAKMNLAIRGLEANLGKHNADSFHDDQHKTLKANFILANPPFNVSDWGGERLQDDIRWRYGVPPIHQRHSDGSL